MNVTEIIQGSTVAWEVRLPLYLPSEGWALKYYFRGAGTGLNLTAVAEFDVFQLEITAAQSQTFTVGDYAWQSIAEKGADKIFIASGNVKIKKGFAAVAEATTIDNRSPVKIALDAIDAMIQGKAGLDQQEYTIGNRSLKRYAMKDLIDLRNHYQRLYNDELRAEASKQGKGGLFTPHYAKFKRP